MKLSFGWKIGLVNCLLSVCLTSAGVYFHYNMSYRLTLEQLAKNLLDVGNVGAMLFDQSDREALKRLKIRALDALQPDR